MVKNLVLIPIHTKPADAEKELNDLHDVVQAVKDKWGIEVRMMFSLGLGLIQDHINTDVVTFAGLQGQSKS